MSYESIQESCKEILERDGYRCQHIEVNKITGEQTQCDKPAIEIAHRISKGKAGQNSIRNYLFMEYGEYPTQADILREFIHSPENLAASCKKHNDNFNCLFNPEMMHTIIDTICERKKMQKKDKK